MPKVLTKQHERSSKRFRWWTFAAIVSTLPSIPSRKNHQLHHNPHIQNSTVDRIVRIISDFASGTPFAIHVIERWALRG